MKIALICPFNNKLSISYSLKVIKHLSFLNVEIYIHEELLKNIKISKLPKKYFSFKKLNSKIDFLFSIGGDGSILQSVTLVKDTNIPILGINTGKLGFLTNLQKESIELGLKQLLDSKYSIIKRSLLEVNSPNLEKNFFKFNFALNEISVSRKNTTSLISISTHLNNVHLTTFWADGLIISTPTGSTGYSLSSGGPIMTPESSSFVLTPIAPHNLNIRPLIINDNTTIKISVSGRGDKHLISLDSRNFSLSCNTEIILKKAPFTISTVQLYNNSFLNTLREKLFWGLDTRN